MESAVNRLVEDFEKGKMTRRELVKHVAGIATAAALAGGTSRTFAAETSTFKATGVNHIALNTPDIAGSRDFYVKHLGMKVVREGNSNCFMTCNDDFVALFKSPKSGMNHYCYSVENFDVADAQKKLRAEGLKPRREGNRIYFNDPHGLSVQLASHTHHP